MANKIKYPFSKMKIGDFHRLHYTNKVDVCRAQAVAYVNARNKNFILRTSVVNFMLEVWRDK